MRPHMFKWSGLTVATITTELDWTTELILMWCKLQWFTSQHDQIIMCSINSIKDCVVPSCHRIISASKCMTRINKEIRLHCMQLYTNLYHLKLNRSALILTILHSLADCKCKVASLFVGLTQVWQLTRSSSDSAEKIYLTHCCDGWKANTGDHVCDRPGSAAYTRTSPHMWVTLAYNYYICVIFKLGLI